MHKQKAWLAIYIPNTSLPQFGIVPQGMSIHGISSFPLTTASMINLVGVPQVANFRSNLLPQGLAGTGPTTAKVLVASNSGTAEHHTVIA